MIGNSITYPEATHNQSLPIVTMVSMLGLQDHWCIWFFGAGPYQLLPMLTILSHAVIGELGALEAASTKHYQHLPTHGSGQDLWPMCLYQAPPPGNNNRYYILLELYVW